MYIICCSGGGGSGCTSGVGAAVTARYAVDPSVWNSVISVAVGNRGVAMSGTITPLGGYGTGFGGRGYYDQPNNYFYGGGGGGGSSVALGVRDREPCTADDNKIAHKRTT